MQSKPNYTKLFTQAKKIRDSSLLNKKYYPVSVLCLNKGNKSNLNKITLADFNKKLEYKNSDNMIWEECYYTFLQSLSEIKNIEKNKVNNYFKFKCYRIKQILDTTKHNEKDDRYYTEYIETTNDNKSTYLEIKKSGKFNKNVRIAMANIKIENTVFSQETLSKNENNPFNVDNDYNEKLQNIINQSIKENIKILVLPELSVPLKYLEILIKKSRESQMAIVCCLQHIIADKHAINVQVTILPFMRNEKIIDAFVDFRLKKHYSHEEARILQGLGYLVPELENTNEYKDITEHYIYNWHGVFFSSINCYEFASIEERTKFKSKVDLLILSEWNKDTHYFSNLIESSVNDIHCYIAQSNTSQFGDSRIIAPKSKDKKNLIQVKGGKNSFIIYDDIDIDELRNFQRLKYELQKDDEDFKPTPPSFFIKDNPRLANETITENHYHESN